ncbi:hypothetical protein IFM46972_01224 [Aspergillus udagawae]|uniref:Uncharacterized protein n=1 Tax=Aspergillus udagawae TaxID=91492 RepID=A0A8H3N2F9_9EURO|nr:hypothetical protein IFM46972_01224 [Aspergillus udagawae]
MTKYGIFATIVPPIRLDLAVEIKVTDLQQQILNGDPVNGRGDSGDRFTSLFVRDGFDQCSGSMRSNP